METENNAPLPAYEAKFQREITELVMRHIDRMEDVCEQDTADRIIESFTRQFHPIFQAYLDEKFPERQQVSHTQSPERPFEPRRIRSRRRSNPIPPNGAIGMD
jgi:hypothetical protein